MLLALLITIIAPMMKHKGKHVSGCDGKKKLLIDRSHECFFNSGLADKMQYVKASNHFFQAHHPSAFRRVQRHINVMKPNLCFFGNVRLQICRGFHVFGLEAVALGSTANDSDTGRLQESERDQSSEEN